MSSIVAHMRGIMIVAGVLTMTMIYAAISPSAALQSTFGETLNGPLADLVVRSWGALIALVGAMLVYGAFNPTVRPLVLTVAAVSKAVFITLVLFHGRRFLASAGVPLMLDSAMVVVFAAYIAATRPGTRTPAARAAGV
jgi:hypothetical protein